MTKVRAAAALVVVLVVVGLAIYVGVGRARHDTPTPGPTAAAGPGATPGRAPMNIQALVSGLSPEQRQQAYTTDVEQLRARLSRLQAFVDGFPAALTSVEALAQSLGTPAAAFEFVRDQLALEPYPGILKGADATLITRGGNSLDRALLLAELLKQNGVSAVIAHGRLSPEQTRGLLQRIVAAPGATERMLTSLPMPAAGPVHTANQREVANTVSRRAQTAAGMLRNAVTETHPIVEASVKQAGLAGEAEARDRQIAILSDHYWVQATIDGQTVDLDPSPGVAAPNQRLAEAADTFEAATPAEELFQRVRFRLVAEFVDNGRLRTSDVFSEPFSAVDLFGKNIRLAVAPQSPNANESRCHAVLLVGDRRLDGRPFDLTAGAAPKSSSGGPDTGAGGLFGALGNVGAEEQPASERAPAVSKGAQLGRLYLEVASTAPGLLEARYERMIMDRVETSGSAVRIQPAMADDATARALLVQAWDGATSVGPSSAVYLLQVTLDAMKAHEAMEEKARAQVFLGESLGVDDLPAPMLSKELVDYYFTSDVTRFLLGREHAPGARSYYERPRLAFFRHGFVVADWSRPGAERRFAEGIDLINAPLQFAGAATDAARLAREAGVADTALEATFMAGGQPFNTLPLFAAAAAQNVRTLTVKAGDAAALQAVAVPEAIKQVLRQELARGQTLLVPASLVTLNGVRTYGWWSIDPATGMALGKMELGGAQGLVEVSKMHERVEKWTEIFTKFYGGVMKCYLGALGDSLGSIDALEGKVEIKHGAPGESPMPTMSKLAECVISQACDTIAELITEAAITPAFAKEAEDAIKPLQRLIAEWVMEQAVEDLKSDVSGGLSADCQKSFGG